MSEPIDIKTKKTIPSKFENKFEKSFVLNSLEDNILSHWDTWGKFQQAWTSRAYRSFKDLDKYVVLIYLIKNNWQTLTDKFQVLSMDEFYDTDSVIIDKINLIQISNDLSIPKETIRRKVNELQSSNILTRHRKVFGDLETWVVWGNIGLSHQYQLAKAAEKNLITSEITLKSYYSNVADVKINRGVNASSIADISSIPRATVIRKLNWLVSQKAIKKNKNLEYQMKKGGLLNKRISDNFLINQHSVAEFLTDIFDLMKNSNFKV